MKRRSWKSLRWLAGIGLLAALIAGIGLLWPRERLLTEVARPIAKFDTAREQAAWISHSRLVIVTTEQQGGEPNIRWRGFVDQVDTVTNTRTRLAALTDLLNRTTVFPFITISDVEASPDGAWLQWQTYGHRTELGAPHVARLDGTHYRAWPENTYEDSLFLDSDHLFEKNSDQTAALRDLWDPSHDRVYPHPEDAQAAFSRYASHSSHFLVVPHWKVYGTASCEIDRYRTEDRLALILAEHNSHSKAPQPVQIQKVRFATGVMFQRAEVAPQQQAILYHLKAVRTPPLLTLLQRLWPHLQTPTRKTEELWISRADGSEMVEIGYVPVSSTSGLLLENPQWLPDGRGISFVYQDTLYVAPVSLKN